MAEDYVTFVVHGVGAARKSDAATIDAATKSFAQAWSARSGAGLTWTQHTAATEGVHAQYSVATGTTTTGVVHRIVPLHWADMSPASSGPFGAPLSFFRLLFGARRITHAAATSLATELGETRHWPSRLLAIVEGPIIGLNAVLVVAFLVQGFWPSRIEPVAAFVVIGSITVGAALLTSHAFRVKLPFVRHAMIAGLSVAALSFFPIIRPPIRLEWLTDPSDRFAATVAVVWAAVHGLWLLVVIGTAVVAAVWLVSRWRLSKEGKRTWDVQIFTLSIVGRMWLIGIPVLWSVLLRVPLMGRSELLAPGQAEQIAFSFVPAIWISWLSAIVIGLGVIVSAIQFLLETRRHPECNEARAIVAPVILWVVNVMAMVIAPLTLLLLFWKPPTISWLNGIAWALTGAIGIAAYVLRDRIRTILDFLLDVTDYFRTNAPGRDDITQRFKTIIDHVLSSVPSQRVELYLTHSQGTVLLGDLLIGHPRPSATWVTMGSPIGHLYRHYFAHLFWLKGGPSQHVHFARWINLYRARDYIGRRVTGLSPTEQVLLGGGGHRDYFQDHRVLDFLEGEGLVPGRQPRAGTANQDLASPGDDERSALT